jgi:hypothetical protein
MDEVIRLRSLRAAPVAATAARAEAAFALEQAIGGQRRRRLRPTAVVIAFVAAAVLATAAYALYQEVIVGSPAPVSVKNAERMLNEVKGQLIPIKTHGHPDIEIAKTRAAGAISTPIGPIYLWVAPDTRGADCSWLQVVANDLPNGQPNLSGGCTVGGNRISLSIGYRSSKPGHVVAYVCCYVGTPRAKTVELRFTNGTSLTAPVYDKHVLAKTDPHLALAETIVLGPNGQTLAEHHYPRPLSPLQEAARLSHINSPPLGSWHVVATLRTIGTDRLVREQTRARGDGVCYELRLPTAQPAPAANAPSRRLRSTSRPHRSVDHQSACSSTAPSAETCGHSSSSSKMGRTRASESITATSSAKSTQRTTSAATDPSNWSHVTPTGRSSAHASSTFDPRATVTPSDI